MTKRFCRYTISATQKLCGLHPTFTLNLELYCLTNLAVSEMLQFAGNRPPRRRRQCDNFEFPGDGLHPGLPHALRAGTEIRTRASIDVALVVDTTRTC